MMVSLPTHICVTRPQWVNTLRPRQSSHHFADDFFKCIFLNEDIWISINISLKFVPKGQINNIPALDQIMAWHRPGDKPLSELMMVIVVTYICSTQPQWVYHWILCFSFCLLVISFVFWSIFCFCSSFLFWTFILCFLSWWNFILYMEFDFVNLILFEFHIEFIFFC